MQRKTRVIAAAAALLLVPLMVANGCSSTPDHESTTAAAFGLGGSGGTTASSTGTGKPGSGGNGQGGTGGIIIIMPEGGPDAPNDVMQNPCGTQCVAHEVCDQDHLGLDDNCNGTVDETCSCTAGAVHSCFKGDPSYHNAPGCHDGTMRCSENGSWGPCVGGIHATPDQKCYENNTTNCHAISAPPFADVTLKDGTGAFSNNADSGSETYTVTCPMGVSPCPTVMSPDLYKPIQSGEYQVTYNKTVMGTAASCSFSLFVGAPGLRVELSWEHPEPGGESGGVDLDLHLHEPGTTTPWSMHGSNAQDCGYGNCKAGTFTGASTPHWFPDANMPPDPVNWFKDPVHDKNTCYFAPSPYGSEWASQDLGCHNPRLDADDISCDSGETDSTASNFCYPENINVDYPPKKSWTRVGVYYYSSHSVGYSVHPVVKIFCNGELAAELGDAGYYIPNQPVVFASGEGENTSEGNVFWEVADVAFTDNMCSNDPCVVKPIYADSAAKTPFLVTDTVAEAQFTPAYPAPLP